MEEQPKVVRQLKEAYEAWFEDVSSTRKNNYEPPRIVLGSSHDPIGVLTRQDWRNGTWAPNSNGYWLVDVESAGSHEIKLVYDAAGEDETVKVEFGKAVLESTSPSGSELLVIERVQLVPGPQKVQATLQTGDRSRGPYQIIVSKAR